MADNNQKKFLDLTGTSHLVDKLRAMVADGAVMSADNMNMAVAKGVYCVSNTISANSNFPSVAVVAVFQGLVMQTWYDNDGSVKRRRSTDGGDTWGNWNVLRHATKEEVDEAGKNVIYIYGTVKNVTTEGQAPGDADTGNSSLYIDEGNDTLILRHNGHYYTAWQDDQELGNPTSAGVRPFVATTGVKDRLYVDHTDMRVFVWDDGFYEISNSETIENVKKLMHADLLMEYGEDGLTIGEQVYQNMCNINAFNDRLDTLMDSTGVAGAIDTFKDVENFLQGVTDTQTLTGLLQQQEKNLGGRGVVYINEFVTMVNLSPNTSPQPRPGGAGYTMAYDMARGQLLTKSDAGTYFVNWYHSDLDGSVKANTVKPTSEKLYIAPKTGGGYEVYIWDGTTLVEIHKAKLDSIEQRLDSLESAEPDVISTAEIDAMFRTVNNDVPLA